MTYKLRVTFMLRGKRLGKAYISFNITTVINKLQTTVNLACT